MSCHAEIVRGWEAAGYVKCSGCNIYVHPTSAPPFDCGQDCDTPGSLAVFRREEAEREPDPPKRRCDPCRAAYRVGHRFDRQFCDQCGEWMEATT